MTEQHTGGPAGGQGRGSGGAAKADATAGSGLATDAVAAFGSALVKAAEAKPVSTADSLVSTAFALGWHMSELYERHLPADKRKPLDLPGLGSLSEKQHVTILADQVEAGVTKLKRSIAQSGLDSIDLTGVKALGQAPAGDDPILRTHLYLLGELTAADPRLGKAYGLGRALADSCREPRDPDSLAGELDPPRIANLLRWLDDLDSAFPPHAASSVAKSLMKWRDALHPPSETPTEGLNRREKVKAPWEKVKARWDRWQNREAITAPAATKDAIPALRRQGELWRALLSGEKQGTDMLEIDNYLDAARRLSVRTAAIVRGVVVRMPLLSTLVLALAGVGVWLLAEGGSAQLVAGVTSVLAALGLTWKGLGGALGKLAGKLEQPLWGAVLDDAIADAVTLLPSNKADVLGRRQIALTVAGQARSDEVDPSRPA
jgi:hypothetical protein